ncbi:hypothetical protein SAMN06265795_11026 [Noviherbaspirillum humi]|uniref:Uncharacterized protein n=1 Tax=Noviherbaspirillum humi TaxID=1688639 RepID=A0A239IM14_9BURK|nr:hypothetical protein [Noviherbaspirillum humi]SNS94710.1 hypothetical protein SAMN06265795_11026 [Noviherbaspirillum humi]
MLVTSTAYLASDTSHRIDHPNSSPRHIRVVGIGIKGADSAQTLNAAQMRHVRSVSLPASAGPGASMEATLQCARDQGVDLTSELRDADLIFLVAHAGDDVSMAPAIKQLARQQNVSITGVLVQDRSAAQDAASLEVLRASSDMLIIASDNDYVEDMLQELGA